MNRAALLMDAWNSRLDQEATHSMWRPCRVALPLLTIPRHLALKRNPRTNDRTGQQIERRDGDSELRLK